MGKKFLILIVMVVLRTVGSYAEDVELERIVVSATKTEEAIERVGASVTVITKQEIEQRGAKTVLEALRTVPELNVVQTGSLGGTTSVFIRGAKPEHTLVMVDGIEMNDPMSAGRSFDFAHLTTDNIERIEIIRGPQSTLYGSDAIGGVINIITKKGRGLPKLELSTEGGSFETFRESIALNGSTQRIGYALSGSRIDSRGISKAKDGAEKDSYENTTFSSRVDFGLPLDSNLSLILRYTNAVTDIDDGAYDDDPNYIFKTKSVAMKTQFEQKITDSWEQKIGLSWLNFERWYRDDPDSKDPSDAYDDWYDGENKKFDWQNNLFLNEFNTITSGFEYEQERGAHKDVNRRKVNNKAVYFQDQLKLYDKLFTTVGIRFDDHDKFGSNANYKLSSAYLIEKTATKLKANLGTGFKAPTLYQLYDPTYGNSDLLPDESESYDVGIEQKCFRIAAVSLNYFHNQFKNMVDYDFDTNKYKNIGKAKTSGTELDFSLWPVKDLNITVSYTRTNTRDNVTGKELRWRPKDKSSLNLDWNFLSDKGHLALIANYFSHRWNNAANTQKMKPYTKVDLSTSYQINDGLQVFGRIENLFDRKYEEVRGYATPGASFYGGVKATF